MSTPPDCRIRRLNPYPVQAEGQWVLYWMVAQRRPTWNASLDRAVHWAVELQRPLVILEALRAGYPWASDRLHQFVVEGMADNGRAFASAPATYYPYLESKPGEGRGLLESLAAASCLVVTDDFPCFFLPRMLEAAADKIDVPLEAVDGNGLYPMRATTKVFARAYDFRRFLQKQLRPHLDARPSPNPFRGVVLPDPPKIPSSILARWPMADVDAAATHPHWLDSLAIDHSVGVSPVLRGGVIAAEKRLDGFLHHGLPEYADSRNDATRQIASGLSPYLHFGHISAHQIFDRLVDRERWDASQIAEKAKGSRHGWWGMSEATESFLDELVTWRELGFNMCAHQADYDQYASLPQWARTTLSEHAGDPRPYVYELETLEAADTHDGLWNAAQTQLLREGRMHNYMRMLWGKKILEWSATPEEALHAMIELNNKYAIDGRNPNSYSGIFWVLGRYDRAWGPERPIFGKIRYMSSENTARKLKVKSYLETYAPTTQRRWC